MLIEKGAWVRIEKVVLSPSERVENIPEDTKKTPLKMWTKGTLQKDCNIGEIAIIKTLSNRVEEGTLVAVNHTHNVDFGEFIPEILQIGIDCKKLLFENGDYNG